MARPKTQAAPPAPAPTAGFFQTSRMGFKPKPAGSARNPYFPPNEEMVVKIESVSVSHRKQAYVIEGTIVEGPEDAVGSRRSCIIKNNEYQPQNVAEFVCAAYGCNPASAEDICQFGDEAFNASYQPGWSQIGKLIRLRTRMKETKAGNDFTAHYWQPHENTTAETMEDPSKLLAVVANADAAE